MAPSETWGDQNLMSLLKLQQGPFCPCYEPGAIPCWLCTTVRVHLCGAQTGWDWCCCQLPAHVWYFPV